MDKKEEMIKMAHVFDNLIRLYSDSRAKMIEKIFPELGINSEDREKLRSEFRYLEESLCVASVFYGADYHKASEVKKETTSKLLKDLYKSFCIEYGKPYCSLDKKAFDVIVNVLKTFGLELE